ncbi:MAG: helix-turn-helix transcriptional regulator [bacterium]|nr:helix-turn-helix transcriptional regulator [bacterium]
MEYYLKERIGNPKLFSGRQEELGFFLKWIDGIKQEKSKSTAILARRKMGKTALMERLFNITFYRNDGVIPFYYEVKEEKKWAVAFCKDFFFTFLYQYIAFKSRNTDYLNRFQNFNFDKAKQIAEKEGLGYLNEMIEGVAYTAGREEVDDLWLMVRDTPRNLAARRGEFIVQLIDEFQFLNSEIYWDRAKTNRADDFAAGYLSTAESKVAPLIVSGSWVGWLMNLLMMMLPSRFKFTFPGDMPQDEAIEMIFNYSRFFEVPVTEETAYLIAQLLEGSPFYMAALLCSAYPDKDLTTVDGLIRTLEFESLDNRGDIKFTWMEYVAKAFSKINDRNAKNIVLYLCKHRDREVTRKELSDELQLDMTDTELENRLKALVKADIIQQGETNFDYKGIQDNIFDKVFRGVYQKEIDGFEPGEIAREYRGALEKLKKQFQRLQGKYNYQKGYFAEYVILDQLMHHAGAKNTLFKSITRNLPADFDFCAYESVWTYRAAVVYAGGLSVDILARAKSPGDYSIIGEVKNREKKKFSKEEAAAFLKKFRYIIEKEKLSRVTGFIFSRKGFTKEAESYLQTNGIAYSDDSGWLER